MIRPTHRFRANRNWINNDDIPNSFFFGLIYLICQLRVHLRPNSKMIEIGTHMGESSFLFASSGLFSHIDIIDPLSGTEEFNELFGYSWPEVVTEYNINTRLFKDIITLHQDYSYNIADSFENESVDFIYIDADHSEDSVRKDLNLYLPKLRPGGIIAGHDYVPNWPGVRDAVDSIIGKPDETFEDTSWYKIIDKWTLI